MKPTEERRFEELLATSMRRLSAIARSYARGEEGKDLLQEILLQIWRSLERFEGRSTLDTWGRRAVDPPFEGAKKGILQNVTRLDRRQLRRDLREVAIAAGATGVLAATLAWATEPWLRAWILILSATAALIGVWRSFTSFRRRSHPTTAGSLATFCCAEMSRLDTEIRLQRTLAWWYLAPILVGTNLYVLVSSGASTRMMMVFFPISAAIVAAIALVTRRSLRRELLPLRVELDHCLAELEADGSARVC